jgi:hypothetical protein
VLSTPRPSKRKSTKFHVDKFHLILHLTGNKGAVMRQWRSIERVVEKMA